jgi:hypothetical protein
MPPTRPPEEDQERLYPAIADALFQSVSQEWEHITLRVAATPAGQLALEVSGPDGTPCPQVPDDSLYPPVLALYDLFAIAARPWTACTFQLHWITERETWRYTADFAYPPEA